jgi:hypothetical protein
MTKKLEQYTDVINRLVSETVKCTPQEWTKGTLTIDCDGTRINYKLKNEDQPGAASISEKLRDLIDELYVRMAQQGDTWIEAALTFQVAGNDVNFKTDFKYAAPKEPTVIATDKPWWKVW